MKSTEFVRSFNTVSNRGGRYVPAVINYIVRVNGACVYEGTDSREALSYKTRCPYTHVKIEGFDEAGELDFEYEWAG